MMKRAISSLKIPPPIGLPHDFPLRDERRARARGLRGGVWVRVAAHDSRESQRVVRVVRVAACSFAEHGIAAFDGSADARGVAGGVDECGPQGGQFCGHGLRWRAARPPFAPRVGRIFLEISN